MDQGRQICVKPDKVIMLQKENIQTCCSDLRDFIDYWGPANVQAGFGGIRDNSNANDAKQLKHSNRDSHFGIYCFRASSMNCLIPSKIPSARRCLTELFLRSLRWLVLVMNPTSTSTLGIVTSHRTRNPACLTPRSSQLSFRPIPSDIY